MSHAITPIELGISPAFHLPTIFAPNQVTARRFVEFFTVNIRNPHTRKAYARAAAEFADWSEGRGIVDLRRVQPVHVAAYIEGLTIAAPSIKLRLAALRMLFHWLVIGRVIPVNPASSVRGPRHVVKKGKTPVLAAYQARALLAAIDTTVLTGLRDRALIGLMVYTFARVGAVIQMRLEDVYVQGQRTWIRLHEKGGKQHEMPCHHNLDTYLHAYLEGAKLEERKGVLFRSALGRTGQLTERPMSQPDVYRMIRRRAEDAKIKTLIGCHAIRATGITEYLRNGGKLKVAQQMAHHASARTTGLYDRRDDQVSLDEIERIVI